MDDLSSFNEYLVINAIVRLKESDQTFCGVCSKVVSDVNAHCLVPRHKIFLNRFNQKFVRRSTGCYCLECLKRVDWLSLHSHAVEHGFAPWVKPENLSKTFFDNHIVQFGIDYYCSLCNRIFDYWDAAERHTDSYVHQRLREAAGHVKHLKIGYYSLLVRHCFSPGQDCMTIDCKVCGTIGLDVDDVLDHFQTANHEKNRAIFIAAITKNNEEREFEIGVNDILPHPSNARCETTLNQFANQDRAIPKVERPNFEHPSIATKINISKPKIPKLQSIRAYFARRAGSRYMAKEKDNKPDPNCLMTFPALGDHGAVKNPRKIKHNNATTHQPRKPKISKKINHDDVNDHDRVPDATQRTNNDSPTVTEEMANSTTSESSKLNIDDGPLCLFVVKRNARKSFCQICEEKPCYVSTRILPYHITSERHRLALKRYGCENIIAESNDSYQCRSCDCKLSNLENVYLHVKDKKHLSSLVKASNVENKKNSKKKIHPPTSINNENKKLSENFLSDYIAKQLNESMPSRFYDPSGRGMISNFSIEPDSYSRSEQSAFEKSATGRKYDNVSSTIRTNGTVTNNDRSNSMRHEDFPYSCISTSDDNDPEKQPELVRLTASMVAEISRLISRCHENASSQRSIEQNKSNNGKPEKTKPDDISIEPTGLCHCPICGFETFGVSSYHAHMACHYTQEFVRARRRRKNEKSIRNLVANDDSTERKNNENPLKKNSIDDSGDFEKLIDDKNHVEKLIDDKNDVEKLIDDKNDVEKLIDDKNDVEKLIDDKNDVEKFTDDKNDPDVTMKNEKIDENVETDVTSEKPKLPRKELSRAITDMGKVVKLLEFNDDYIYDLDEKFSELETGLKLALPMDSSKIYCLICREIVERNLDDYHEHLCDVNHCGNLEEMETDDRLFDDSDEQFSDLDLAREYMQEISDDEVRCIICDLNVRNNVVSLTGHINHELHESKCEQNRAIAMKFYEEARLRMRCEWYDVEKYWCVPCGFSCGDEIKFVHHLNKAHDQKKNIFAKNPEKILFFDYCPPCALLWYGYRYTSFYHKDVRTHKWHERDGYYVSWELSNGAKKLLQQPQKFIDEIVDRLDENSDNVRDTMNRMIEDLEEAVKKKFSRAKAHVFGSRVTGLSSPNSDIDVFLDCMNVYDGNSTKQYMIDYFMKTVDECLRKNPTLWDIKELVTDCRCPIIRAYHRSTGLNCDISFDNGLAVENTKLIKTFIRMFPTCRKLILFVKQWLVECGLSGVGGISNYAIYWYVIFYLQKESILPSVTTLLGLSRKSRLVAGWEVGVVHSTSDFDEESSDKTIKDFLIRFFTFYADFDFRREVACPLLGDAVKKLDFAEPRRLPDEMKHYGEYMQTSADPEPLRIDSPMCIQDPYDLQHNLTKAVNKTYVNRFRKYCIKSLDVLWSS